MNKVASIAALVLLLAACSSESTPSTTVPVDDTSSTTTITTETTITTTTAAPSTGANAGGTCEAIKVALFDLDQELRSTIEQMDPEADLSDQEAAEAIFGPVRDFYVAIGEAAETAPDEVAGALASLATAVEPIGEAVASGDPAQLESLIDASGELGFDVPGAETADEWLAENCDIDASLNPSVLIVETMMNAMFAGLGEALTELGSGLEDFGDFEDGFTDGTTNMVYGDDPELDALWDRCQADDDEACDELYWETFGLYELFSQTCGGRAPYHPDAGGACETRMDTAGPSEYGTDAYFDSLWDSCADGDDFSCDILAGSAPIGSEYAEHGLTCAGTRDALPRSCEGSQDAYTYGDDVELDALWASCVAGDGDACSDLWFESPFGSEYETVGDACGALLERSQSCEIVLELLGQPAG